MEDIDDTIKFDPETCAPCAQRLARLCTWPSARCDRFIEYMEPLPSMESMLQDIAQKTNESVERMRAIYLSASAVPEWSSAALLWQKLVDTAYPKMTVTVEGRDMAGNKVVEAFTVREGVPRPELDMTEDHSPQEAEDRAHKHQVAVRLLALNQYDLYLKAQDGHIWIESGMEDTGENHDDQAWQSCSYFHKLLREKGVLLNNKIYGGILEALNAVDAALQLAGEKPLAELYDPDWMFLGDDTHDTSRIQKVEPGHGGIY